jgi:CarD family transcriptional regulator
MLMKFSIGDKIVHPHRGPGRIVDVKQREFLEGVKRYYVIEIPVYGMTVHIPVRKAAELGMRPAMPRAKVDRVLDTLRSQPRRLSKDYKERQKNVWEKIKTGRPIATAEAVRDLTWRGRHANLTKKDSELLQRGQDFLAAEMALVLETDVPEANESITSALDVAMVAMMEKEERQQQLAAAIP